MIFQAHVCIARSIVNYTYILFLKAKPRGFSKKTHGKVYDCLYVLFIVLICCYVYTKFLSAFLHLPFMCQISLPFLVTSPISIRFACRLFLLECRATILT